MNTLRPTLPTRLLALALLALLPLACTPPNTPAGGSGDTDEAADVAEETAAGKTDDTETEADEVDVPSDEATAEPAGLVNEAGFAAVAGPDDEPVPVTLMLDWVPNTNHTGLFVAQAEGYFAEAGLDVEIVQPGEVFAEQAVAAGAADFGISFQEALTLARADAVPLVSVAAILQHNTSSFASRSELGASSAADFAGLRYGTFGTPFEMPTLEALMACAGATEEAIASVEEVNIGLGDPLALLAEEQIDLAWIFEGWQGVQADREGIALTRIAMDDHFDCIPDYYTPILVASEDTVEERPELAAAFVGAVARGYAFAIERPLDAAEILLTEVPELDLQLVLDSQTWISPRYQAEAPRWGEQQLAVWDAYSDWMAEQGIIAAPIDPEAAFTNAFLP